MTFLYDGYTETETEVITGYKLTSGFKYSARTVELQYNFRIDRATESEHIHTHYLPPIEVEIHRDADDNLVPLVLIQTSAIGSLAPFQHKEFMEAHELASQASKYFQEKIDKYIEKTEQWYRDNYSGVDKDSFTLYPSHYSSYLDMQTDLHNRNLMVFDDGQYLINLETKIIYKHDFKYFRTIKDMYDLGKPIYMEEVDEDIAEEIMEANQ